MASQHGQQAVASAGRARHTFYLPKLGGKFKPFSLLSGRASGRQKVGLQGRRGTDSRDARGEEDHRQKGAPWRLLVTLLWEGLRAASQRTAPQLLSELRATLPTAGPAQPRPDSPSPASAHWQRGATFSHEKDMVAGWLAGWQWGRFPQQCHIPGMFLINHDRRRHHRQKHHDST